MAKDLTKYAVLGIADGLGKARLVQQIIEDYAKKFVGSYEELKTAWPDDLQGGKGVFCILSEIDAKNERNYYVDSPISLKTGTEIAVCNQWGASNFPQFINHAKNLGYEINAITDNNAANSSDYQLPDVIVESLSNKSNSDYNIFDVYQYKNEHITNDDDLEQLYLAVIKFKPNAKIVSQYAWELFKKNRIEVAASLFKNRLDYTGDDHDWECFNSAENDFLKTLAIDIPFKEYQSENNAELNVVINIYGRMHQIFECINEEEEDIDAIEDHYPNIFDWKYKIDDDNLMIIEIDGDKIFEGSISELAIRDDTVGYDLESSQQDYIKPKLKKIIAFDEFRDFDTDDIWVSKKNYLLRIPQGRLRGDRGLELAPNFNNRYSMINYGKYHLEASVKVKSFSISDLFFQMDPNMDELISEPDGGPFYNFSKIFHYEKGELELEIVSDNVKDTEFQNGWLYDL